MTTSAIEATTNTPKPPNNRPSASGVGARTIAARKYRHAMPTPPSAATATDLRRSSARRTLATHTVHSGIG